MKMDFVSSSKFLLSQTEQQVLPTTTADFVVDKATAEVISWIIYLHISVGLWSSLNVVSYSYMFDSTGNHYS